MPSRTVKKGMSVRVVDRGLDGLFARVKDTSADFGSDVGVVTTDPETAYIARVHELGLGNNPQRSFLRKTMEMFRAKYAALAARAYGMFLDGKVSISQAMNLVNTEIVADIQKRILRGIPPALADGTLASKKRRGLPRPKTPLYATGKLFHSIKARMSRGNKGKA